MKNAFLFPGQGSQYVGMARELIETHATARAVMETADEILAGRYEKPLSALCSEGPEDLLKRTDITQPAIFTVSHAVFAVLEEKGILPSVTAGNSLGEYNALVAAGVFGFEEALPVVADRGLFMHEDATANPGSMAAIIGLDPERVEEICEEVEGICEPALFNSPGQVVISGAKSSVAEAMERASAAGAKKVVELAVSGSWHSALMTRAQGRLAEVLSGIEIRTPRIPVVMNVTAEFETEADRIREALAGQLTRPVRWVESMEKILASSPDRFIEAGPGRVLAGLMKRIDRKIAVVSVEKPDKIEALSE